MQQAFVCLQRTETDLYGKLVSISVQTVQFNPCSHRSHPGLTEESGAMSRVLPSEPLRHQYLNFTIQYVFTPITEQLLDLRIDQNNLPLSIYHHHGICSSFQQSLKSQRCAFSGSDLSFEFLVRSF